MPRGVSYLCGECGYVAAKWLGRCPGCDSWETLAQVATPDRSSSSLTAARPRPLSEISTVDSPRLPLGMAEFDRVLGGGVVPGAVVLLGGEPGVGKSTLLLQAAARLLGAGSRVLYVSGEESPAQLKLRAERLDVDAGEMLVVAETEVASIVGAIEQASPDLVIVDSIQAVRCADNGSAPGSVVQVRDSAGRLARVAKERSIPVFLVGHVTKDGALAGPRALEHLVDTVLQFEGERHQAHRMLRSLKNRFGATEELGVFEMTGAGLKEIDNPSALFLEAGPREAPGAAVVAAMVGSRPLLVELQVLVGEPAQGTPRRTSLGVDGNRVAMVLAVLQRSGGLDFASRDVFVNVTGGLRLNEPATDLALALAAASSLRGVPLPRRWTFAGEIGLTGEVRSISRPAPRLREAGRLGFTHAMGPVTGAPREETPGTQRIPVSTLGEALALALAEPRAGVRSGSRRPGGRASKSGAPTDA